MSMITNNPIRYLGPKDCPFTIDGKNLAEMRRSDLRPYAKKFGVSADGSKQEILQRLIGRLKVADAPKELNEL